MVDGLAQEVEREKMKAIGARNLLKSIARERESQKQQLHALLVEKRMELERYCCSLGCTRHCKHGVTYTYMIGFTCMYVCMYMQIACSV